MSILENVSAIKAQIAAAAIAAGRDPSEIQLCAATKMNDADAVRHQNHHKTVVAGDDPPELKAVHQE